MKVRQIAAIVITIIAMALTAYAASAQVNIPSQSWQEDTQHTLNLKTYFPSEAINFAAVGQPQDIFVSISQATGMATFMPSPDFYGIRSVQFYALNISDVTQRIYSNNVTLVVVAVDDPPQITSSPETRAQPGRLYQYQVQASDPDGDALLYTLIERPAGMTVSSTGLIAWTPLQEGSFDVEIRVSAGSRSISQTFTLAVRAESKLRISDIEVKVDDRTERGLEDGDTIGREAKPGSKVFVEVEVENTYTRTEDIKIEDVSIVVRLEGVDQGDDLEEEGPTFDLSADRTKSQRFSFQLPMLIDEGTYDIVIEVEGDDEESSRTYIDTATLTLEVDKERHDLRIMKAEMSQDAVLCGKNSMLLVEVINLGSEDEEDASVEIQATQFGYRAADTKIELPEGDDEDSIFRKTYLIPTAGLAEGVYSIDIRTYYGSRNLEDAKTVQFSVVSCKPAEKNESGTGTPAQPARPGIIVDFAGAMPTGGAVATPVGPEFKWGSIVGAVLLIAVLLAIIGAIFYFGARMARLPRK